MEISIKTEKKLRKNTNHKKMSKRMSIYSYTFDFDTFKNDTFKRVIFRYSQK